MKNRVLVLIVALVCANCTQLIDTEKEVNDIKIALNKSAEGWSDGNLTAYMDVYWKSEKLQFIGKNGITYGWQNTYDNYKKNYPTKASMGTLEFNVLSTDFLAKNLYSLTGEYLLKRDSGDLSGIFTLIFKKVDGKWVIVSDHTQ
jgi:ketosteroid isomerase-like protein